MATLSQAPRTERVVVRSSHVSCFLEGTIEYEGKKYLIRPMLTSDISTCILPFFETLTGFVRSWREVQTRCEDYCLRHQNGDPWSAYLIFSEGNLAAISCLDPTVSADLLCHGICRYRVDPASIHTVFFEWIARELLPHAAKNKTPILGMSNDETRAQKNLEEAFLLSFSPSKKPSQLDNATHFLWQSSPFYPLPPAPLKSQSISEIMEHGKQARDASPIAAVESPPIFLAELLPLQKATKEEQKESPQPEQPHSSPKIDLEEMD